MSQLDLTITLEDARKCLDISDEEYSYRMDARARRKYQGKFSIKEMLFRTYSLSAHK